MKQLALTAALCSCFAAHPQSINWEPVVTPFRMDHLRPAKLSALQQARLKRLLLRSGPVWQGCEGDTAWASNLKTSWISLGPVRGTLVETGPGCARGGQGANGAMWLVQWHGTEPGMLGQLDGWFYRVLPTAHHGLPDVTAGWHMSSSEFDLTLYRFDGHRYTQAGGADVKCPDNGDDRCVAQPGR